MNQVDTRAVITASTSTTHVYYYDFIQNLHMCCIYAHAYRCLYSFSWYTSIIHRKLRACVCVCAFSQKHVKHSLFEIISFITILLLQQPLILRFYCYYQNKTTRLKNCLLLQWNNCVQCTFRAQSFLPNAMCVFVCLFIH